LRLWAGECGQAGERPVTGACSFAQDIQSNFIWFDPLMRITQGDSTICGTREFIAPEIWEYKRQGSRGNGDGPYKAASDVYSLGMTFFEILTHKRPFIGLTQAGDTMDCLFER
jgi:serine/threonine protein kinase